MAETQQCKRAAIVPPIERDSVQIGRIERDDVADAEDLPPTVGVNGPNRVERAVRKRIPDEPRNLIGVPNLSVRAVFWVSHCVHDGILHGDGHQKRSRTVEEVGGNVGLVGAKTYLAIPDNVLAVRPLHREIKRLPFAGRGEPHRRRKPKL